ncbi:T9SS type A sorting domain-containing protein, partial [Flavobacterium sp. F-380]
VSIVAADVNNGSTDACGIATLTLDKTSFTCANVGANTVTLKVTDVNGNIAAETVIVTVEDKIAPVALTKNIAVQLNAAGAVSIVAADVNNGSTDACGIATLTLDKTSFTCANVGANTVTLKVTDVNGNIAAETAIVTVEDKIAPVALTKNITVQLNAAGTVSIVAADVNNGSTDNCEISTLTLDKTNFTCANVGENTVTLKVTDKSGNVTNKTAIVTVEDKVAPVVVTKNKTIQLNAAGTASIVLADINNGSTDACGIATITLDKTSFTCANVGANTVTLRVADIYGNVATQTATVTVEDKIAPTVVTKNITVQLDASSNVLVAATAVNNGSTDNCSIVSYELDKSLFSCGDVGINTVTLKVTDKSGNVAYGTATITVVNSQPNLLRKHFDNVIFFDNSSNSFRSYTWYKNGVLVAGQTAQYFTDSSTLNGSYYAIATKNDGTVLTTCPISFSPSIEQEFIKVAPNPVRANSSYQLTTNLTAAKLINARVTVISMLGTVITNSIVDKNSVELIAPSVEGIYIVKLTLSNGQYFTKNLLVKN